MPFPVLKGRQAVYTHWTQPAMGNYDQDSNVGVVEWQQAEAMNAGIEDYWF